MPRVVAVRVSVRALTVDVDQIDLNDDVVPFFARGAVPGCARPFIVAYEGVALQMSSSCPAACLPRNGARTGAERGHVDGSQKDEQVAHQNLHQLPLLVPRQAPETECPSSRSTLARTPGRLTV
jgi:hypothetical protein